MSTGSSTGAAATAANVDVQKLSAGAKLQLLREHMQRPSRQPVVVLMCATHVLSSGGISDMERAAVTELAVIAALDLGLDEKAHELIRGLVRQFGRKSVRVRRLLGMQLEALGKADQAMQLYAEVLKEHPTEQFCARRRCALLRSRGEYDEAIKALKARTAFVDPKEGNREFTYAEMFPMDEAAARELISLNWLTRNVSECIRYADECVLFDPASYLHHVRLAELCCVDGQLERAATAYAQSLRLNAGRNNLRALYGLWHVAGRLTTARVNARAAADGPAADAAELLAFAESRLKAHYASCATLTYLDLTLKRA